MFHFKYSVDKPLESQRRNQYLECYPYAKNFPDSCMNQTELKSTPSYEILSNYKSNNILLLHVPYKRYFKYLISGSGNIFLKGPDSKYIRFYSI